MVVRIFILLSFCLITFPAFAEEGKQRLTVYGQDFTVTPIEKFDNNLSFEAIKSYIPVVLPEATRVKYDDVEKVVMQLDFGYADYEELYWSSVQMLIPKAKKVYPDRSEEELKAEFDRAFRSGQWKVLADHYGKVDLSIPPQMLDTQKLYNSYLVFSYLYTMVMDSEEITSLAEEGHSEGEGGHDGHVH